MTTVMNPTTTAVASELTHHLSPQGRVLIITYDFPPSLEIGGHTCAQIARHLPRYGWKPLVLTVKTRYIDAFDAASEGTNSALTVRTGMIPHPFVIYRSVKSKFRRQAGRNEQGIASNGMTGAFRRWAVSLLGLPDPYTGWIIPAVISGMAVIRKHQVVHILSSGPRWTNHLVGLALARLTGLPWTALFQDPLKYWTPLELERPPRDLPDRVVRGLERAVVKRANVVVCVTEPHTALLRQAYPKLLATKFITIPHGYDDAEWDNVTGKSSQCIRGRNDNFIITYSGTLYMKRNPLPVFRALRALADSGDISLDQIRVDFIGNCNLAEGKPVTDMAKECGIGECVHITGLLSRQETLIRVIQSDLLLLFAEDLTQQIPGKTYEYLRAGRPILALTSRGALVDLLGQTGGAWVIDPKDGGRIAAALREAYRFWLDGLPGPAPDPAVVKGFDRRVLVGRFAEAFKQSVLEAHG